jgi:glyoxylase-like metal-dependent hydrolase (beta-lactamase superfamily II)
VAIAMKDHVLLVDSPISDARARAIADTLTQQVPDKKIAYVITTHPHFDTLGGLRGMAARGADIIAAESSRALLARMLASKHRIAPDALSQADANPGATTRITGVTEKSVLSDGERQVEIYPLQGALHAKGMLMVYLPAEKLLIQSDAYTPGPPFSTPPSVPQAAHINLLANIERLQLQVDRIVPLRGRVVPLADLYRAVGRVAP